MKIHTVFITHNRLHLTKQAIASYLWTITVPFTYTIVDNASDDGTREFLEEYFGHYTILRENMYPGFATNMGWDTAPDDATILHRADNDMRFLPGWCDAVWEALQDPSVGQVGLRTDEEENFQRVNTGGNCVIRRELWDKGLRWDEHPWGPYYAPGCSEDTLFSPAVRKMGYRWTRVKTPCLIDMATGDPEDPYYQASYGARGIW
jgi:glycosyltransferase involved in cell wall biosynthesis